MGSRSEEILAGVLRGESDTRARMYALWATARLGSEGIDLLALALDAAEPEVRAEALRLLPPMTKEARLATGTPLVAYVYDGGHVPPADAPEKIVAFFKKHARK